MPDAPTRALRRADCDPGNPGQKKLAEAEPILLAGYRGLKEREASIPP